MNKETIKRLRKQIYELVAANEQFVIKDMDGGYTGNIAKKYDAAQHEVESILSDLESEATE